MGSNPKRSCDRCGGPDVQPNMGLCGPCDVWLTLTVSSDRLKKENTKLKFAMEKMKVANFVCSKSCACLDRTRDFIGSVFKELGYESKD